MSASSPTGAGVSLQSAKHKPSRACDERRQRLIAGLRMPLLAAPALIGVSLAGSAHAQTTITTNRTTTYSLGGGVTSLTINPGISVSTSVNPAIAGASNAAGVVITNNGTLNSTDTGPSGYGVTLTNNGTVINAGSINGEGGAGVRLVGGGAVTNQSLRNITSSNYGIWIGSGASQIINDGTIGTGSHAIYLSGGTATITNSGALLSGAVGIYQDAGTATINNTGTIQGNTLGVHLGGSGAVTNSGTIKGVGSTAIGVRLANGGTVVNSGSIAGGASGSAVTFGATGGTLILQTGSALTGTLAGGGAGALILQGTGSFSNTTSGFSTLTMSGTDWTIGGTASASNTSVQTGVLRVTGTLTSSVSVSSGGTLAGTGTVTSITAPSGATVRPGGSSTPGTLTLTGSYISGSGSTLVIQATPSSASRLTVGGTASLNGTLSILTATGDYSANPTFTVLSAGTLLSGTFSSVNVSDVTLTPTVTYDTVAKQVRVKLTASTPPITPPSSGSAVIDTSQPFFVNGDSAVTGATVTFAGGLLKPTQSLSLPQSIMVLATGGGIDANGQTVALTGDISGPGALAIKGEGSIVASGTITNTGGLAVSDGGDLTIANGGVVAVPVTASGGGSLTVQAGAGVGGAVTIDGGALVIDNNGAVNGAVVVKGGGSANVNGALIAAIDVAQGALNIGSTGSVGALVLERGGSLTGVGTVLGPATLSGQISPGNSPGVMTFKAPVTLTDSAALRIEIDGPTVGLGAGHHDALVVQGGSFTAAGALTPVLRGISGDATNTYVPELGQSFTIVTADGGVLGRFSALVQPTSGLSADTRLDALYDAKAIRLVVTPVSYTALSGTRNQREVAAALDAQRPAAGASSPLFEPLYAQTRTGLARSQDQLSGKLHADLLAADLVSRRLVDQAIGDRLVSLRGAANFVQTDGAMVWGAPIGALAESDGDGNAAGAVERVGGLLFGVDRVLEGGATGVSAGYLRNRVESKSGLGRGVAESYQASVYGGFDLRGAVVEGSVGYAYTQFESGRDVVIGALRQFAKGDTHGNDLTANVAASRRFALNDSAWIEPQAGASFDRLSRAGFTETGAATVGLRVDDADMRTARSTIGVRFGARAEAGAWTFQPTASIGWAHDFADITAVSDHVLNGLAFSAAATRPGRDALQVGLGTDIRMSDRLKAGVQIRDEYRKRDNAVAASIILRWVM